MDKFVKLSLSLLPLHHSSNAEYPCFFVLCILFFLSPLAHLLPAALFNMRLLTQSYGLMIKVDTFEQLFYREHILLGTFATGTIFTVLLLTITDVANYAMRRPHYPNQMESLFYMIRVHIHLLLLFVSPRPYPTFTVAVTIISA